MIYVKWIWSKDGDLASKADTLGIVDTRDFVVTRRRGTAFLVNRGRSDLTCFVMKRNRI